MPYTECPCLPPPESTCRTESRVECAKAGPWGSWLEKHALAFQTQHSASGLPSAVPCTLRLCEDEQAFQRGTEAVRPGPLRHSHFQGKSLRHSPVNSPAGGPGLGCREPAAGTPTGRQAPLMQRDSGSWRRLRPASTARS